MTKPVINVTPLIDVLLVLLIIFMVVTPIKPKSMEAQVPEEPALDRLQPVSSVVPIVTVNSIGTIKLNGEVINKDKDPLSILTVRLKHLFEKSEAEHTNVSAKRTVWLKAARSVPYGDAARILDAIKVAGAAPVMLQIDELHN